MSDQQPQRVTTPAPEFTPASPPVPLEEPAELDTLDPDDVREALHDIVSRLRAVERHLGIGVARREHPLTQRRASTEMPRPGIEPMTAED